jgi:hypothetical protein
LFGSKVALDNGHAVARCGLQTSFKNDLSAEDCILGFCGERQKGQNEKCPKNCFHAAKVEALQRQGYPKK